MKLNKNMTPEGHTLTFKIFVFLSYSSADSSYSCFFMVLLELVYCVVPALGRRA